jgi:hypothetical protein
MLLGLRSRSQPARRKATALAFSAAAALHAPYWADTSTLAARPWLRGAGWLVGDGEAAWRGYQVRGEVPQKAFRCSLPLPIFKWGMFVVPIFKWGMFVVP